MCSNCTNTNETATNEAPAAEVTVSLTAAEWREVVAALVVASDDARDFGDDAVARAVDELAVKIAKASDPEAWEAAQAVYDALRTAAKALLGGDR